MTLSKWFKNPIGQLRVNEFLYVEAIPRPDYHVFEDFEERIVIRHLDHGHVAIVTNETVTALAKMDDATAEQALTEIYDDTLSVGTSMYGYAAGFGEAE